MSALPLIAHDRPAAVIAFRRGLAITAAQFLDDMRALVARLPAGGLVQCVRAEVTRLPPIDLAGCAILGTVPAQHMYGFESTVLLPWHSGGALCAERPFFPADIAAALSALPRPRVLISTPVHLRALLTAETALPALELIVSATAMLPANLAREVEHR